MENFSITVLTDQFATNPLKSMPSYMKLMTIQNNVARIGQTPIIQTSSIVDLHQAILANDPHVVMLSVSMTNVNGTYHLSHEDSPKNQIGWFVGYIGAYKKAHNLKAMSSKRQWNLSVEMVEQLSRYDQFVNNNVKMVMVEDENGYKNTVQDLYTKDEVQAVIDAYFTTLSEEY